MSESDTQSPSYVDAIQMLSGGLDQEEIPHCVSAFRKDGDAFVLSLRRLAALPEEILELCIRKTVNPIHTDDQHTTVSAPSVGSPSDTPTHATVASTVVVHNSAIDVDTGRAHGFSTPVGTSVLQKPLVAKRMTRKIAKTSPPFSGLAQAGVSKSRFEARFCSGSQGTCTRTDKYPAHFENHYRKLHLHEHFHSMNGSNMVYTCCGQIYNGDGSVLIRHVWDKHTTLLRTHVSSAMLAASPAISAVSSAMHVASPAIAAASSALFPSPPATDPFSQNTNGPNLSSGLPVSSAQDANDLNAFPAPCSPGSAFPQYRSAYPTLPPASMTDNNLYPPNGNVSW